MNDAFSMLIGHMKFKRANENQFLRQVHMSALGTSFTIVRPLVMLPNTLSRYKLSVFVILLFPLHY